MITSNIRSLLKNKQICIGSLRISNHTKVADVLQEWQKKFNSNKIFEPRESIEVILAHALGTAKLSDVYKQMNKTITTDQKKIIDGMCEKRLKRVPVQYIIGEWDFRELTLKMKPPVFIPTPETEILVELVLNEIDSRDAKHVLELCCGSGAICLSLLHERENLKVTAIDSSEAACALTKENAQRYQLSERITAIQSEIRPDNLLDFICEKFDIIVSNPPYLYQKDLESLQEERRLYEDLRAFNGGEDGLHLIKLIFTICSRLLNPHGKLFLEVDSTHPAVIRNYLQAASNLKLALEKTHKDFNNLDRFVEIIKCC